MAQIEGLSPHIVESWSSGLALCRAGGSIGGFSV